MSVSPWVVPLVSAGGLVVEAAGVTVFILDAMHVASEAISRAQGAIRTSRIRSDNLGIDSISFFDGSDGEIPGGRIAGLHGAVDAGAVSTPSEIRQAIWGRRKLRLGAVLSFAGIAVQIIGSLAPAWFTR